MENNQESQDNAKGGPRTPEGKAKSALNNLRHGLTGGFRIINDESQEEFDTLVAALREEHQPGTPTEEILVQRMAEHFWLSRRARQLQDNALLAGKTSDFALMLRYQTTNDRAFHKCLSEFVKLKQQRLKAEKEFESEKKAEAFKAMLDKAYWDARRKPSPSARKVAGSSNRKTGPLLPPNGLS